MSAGRPLMSPEATGGSVNTFPELIAAALIANFTFI
jgi:hypothetical protein